MLGKLAFVGLLALAVAEKVSFENYQVFRVIPSSAEQLEVLKQLEEQNEGYSFWSGPSELFRAADVMVAPGQLSDFVGLMDELDMRYESYVSNVQRLIDEENPLTREAGFGWNRYHTLDEIYEWLDSMAAQYPDKVQVVVGGKSYQGRQIKGVKLSFGEGKPAVLVEGGIHAREWISPATVTYLLNELLTSQEPSVRELAEAHDWYMFPSFNPDGYVYTHTTNRLWRKTLSKSGLFCQGADANRNWGYKWMSGGASSNPCSETYAGRAPFSEIETRSMSEYIKGIERLFAYISFHSYSQLLLFPYGHTKEHLDNYDESYAMGLKAISALAERYGTKYSHGNIAEAIYVASGSSMDWAKATLNVPVSFTYELRDTGRHGFVLPADQIIPNGQEVVDSLVAMFKEAIRFGYPKPESD
ncbi:zinc carboxypeptidase-like isoform X2 [Phymastichus coffea]|nr:zinc carboxypeptidase-like isoform X2 [Phymastichus coffea]XP_058805443.1 zinc carboxypeptidase-like isoform X2 [Phymastichus coffea]